MIGRNKRWPARWHYLVKGRKLGASPHPLIDAAWYRAEYPDVAAPGIDPSTHYLRSGRSEGRRPNAWFDPEWYRRVNGLAADADVLHHFFLFGGIDRDPSPDFACKDYLQLHPEVGVSGENALAHFLERDDDSRRSVHKMMARRARPSVTDARIEERKRPKIEIETALFVAHAPNGRLKMHVRAYILALRRQGIGVTLIVAADDGFIDDDDALLAMVEGLYVRANVGWDFAAWAHVLRLNRELLETQTLYLLNDSLIGPTSDEEFGALLSRVRAHPADIVGLTANARHGLHLQSFFLSIRARALAHPAFLGFLYDIRALPEKEAVITTYETVFSPTMEAAGLSTGAIFTPGEFDHDLTVYRWRDLLDNGFAFVKASLLTRRETRLEVTAVRAALAARGYSPDRLEPSDLAALPPVSAPEEKDRLSYPAGQVESLRFNRPAQVTLVGPWNFANGLGVASRGYACALMHTGFLQGFAPIESPFSNHARVAPTLGSFDRSGPADVAILHLNPDAWPALFSESLRAYVAAARARVAIFVWESRLLPETFARGAEHINAIWAPSEFCASAFRSLGLPVSVVPHVVEVAAAPDPSFRAEFKSALGLNDAAGIVLYAFDASSYLVRKNPMALLRAFSASGLAARGWRLVMKTKHLDFAGCDAEALFDLLERTRGAVLIDRPLSSAEAHALLDACDVYASPHCSEGFGLTIAEAMAHGKVVIATDFGGSVDFLDSSCGLPVRGEPWELETASGPYFAGTIWAKIDEMRLAEALVSAADMDADARAALGSAAQLRIRHQLSPKAVAARMRVSLDTLIGAGAC